MQPEGNQKGTSCGIRFRAILSQADPTQLGEGNRSSLGHTRERDRSCGSIGSHERYLAMTDFRELVLLATLDPLSADSPIDAVVLVGADGFIDIEVQRVPLQSEGPSLSCRRLPSHDFRNPCPRMLRVVPLLAEVRLPESVQQRLWEPSHQGTAFVGGGPEDRFSHLGPDEVLLSELGIAEIGVGIAVGELQARQASRQMGRQVAQF